MEITYQDPGNIHFGYVGSVLHSRTDLHIGAGLYQIYSETSDASFWKTYFDDSNDYNAIEYGYHLRQESLS